MKISFCFRGAAGTVVGLKYLVETAGCSSYLKTKKQDFRKK